MRRVAILNCCFLVCAALVVYECAGAPVLSKFAADNHAGFLQFSLQRGLVGLILGDVVEKVLEGNFTACVFQLLEDVVGEEAMMLVDE